MATKKIQIIPPGYTDVCYPQTTASVVIEETDKKFMTDEEKTKLSSIAENANNYVHPTTAGNKHIPSGGSSGQVLKYSADGTAQWGDDNNTTYSASDFDVKDLADSTSLRSTWSGKQDALGYTAANDNAVVHDTGNETIAGTKTFSSFPVTPSSAPTSNYQVANKKYVDDNTGSGLPVGGTAGQIITKVDATDYNAAWTTPEEPNFAFTGTLANTSWTGSSAPYTKAVTVTGILAAGKTPTVDVVLSTTWATALTEETEWANIKRIAYTNNTLTFYATAVPSVALNFTGVQPK